jgi:hypothetical protein
MITELNVIVFLAGALNPLLSLSHAMIKSMADRNLNCCYSIREALSWIE